MIPKKTWTLPVIAIVALFGVFGLCRHSASRKVLQVARTPAATSPPERIVSLAPNLTEILFALGLGEKVIAVSNNCDYPPEAAGKPKVGTFWQPNTEAIIAAKPDLVVTLWFEQQKAVADTLSRIGLNVWTVRIEEIAHLYTAIGKIGEASGCEEWAEQLVRSIRGRMDELRSRFATAEKVKVLWIVQTEPLRVAGRDTFVNQLIELVGGENAIGPTVQQYPPVGTEELLNCGAEVIIQSAMATGDIEQQQTAAEAFWSRFAPLPAVKNSRIYVVQPDTMLRLGPRLPAGAETIARCLHPNISKQQSQ